MENNLNKEDVDSTSKILSDNERNRQFKESIIKQGEKAYEQSRAIHSYADELLKENRKLREEYLEIKKKNS